MNKKTQKDQNENASDCTNQETLNLTHKQNHQTTNVDYSIILNLHLIICTPEIILTNVSQGQENLTLGQLPTVADSFYI